VRELEVGCALARGESYEQIAGHLHVQPSTVKHHVHELRQKLELQDRYAIAAYFSQPLAYSPSPLWGGKDYP
jgi:DNA-binding NarL/FixJ family response regulator